MPQEVSKVASIAKVGWRGWGQLEHVACARKQADPAPSGLLPSGTGSPGLSYQLMFQKKPEIRVFTKHNVRQLKHIYWPKATSAVGW